MNLKKRDLDGPPPSHGFRLGAPVQVVDLFLLRRKRRDRVLL